ncbi:MAG: histidine phosphatase family protein [Oligoflexia bacterium]|nr:histidine phosphatase family protein [Oligoflexia bacterium]
MRIVFSRHGQQQHGELDGALTSAGHRMVQEAAEWLAGHKLLPDHCLLTDTVRTHETAAHLLAQAPHVRRQIVSRLPESRAGWRSLVDHWGPRIGDHGLLLMVGHHPSLQFLLQSFGPPPEPIGRNNYAATLVLDRLSTGTWAISGAFPGVVG